VPGISKEDPPSGPATGPGGTSNSGWACRRLACMNAGA